MRGFIIGLIVTSTISILLCLIKDDDGYLYLPIKLVYVFIRSIGNILQICQVFFTQDPTLLIPIARTYDSLWPHHTMRGEIIDWF